MRKEEAERLEEALTAVVNGDDVYTKTDLLRVALRDRHVDPDWYLRGQ